ncbi:MAG: hypothetical protein U0935_20900 [Pirellulales bacterium]
MTTETGDTTDSGDAAPPGDLITCGEVRRLGTDARCGYFASLPVFQQALDGLDEYLKTRPASSHLARIARLGDYLAYSFSDFPEESAAGRPNRPTHWRVRRLREWVPGTRYTRWLAVSIRVGERRLSRLQEMLLVTLCENRDQWPLTSGAEYPAQPRDDRPDPLSAFLDLYALYDPPLRDHLQRKFGRRLDLDAVAGGTWATFWNTFLRADAEQRWLVKKHFVGYLLTLATWKALDWLRHNRPPPRPLAPPVVSQASAKADETDEPLSDRSLRELATQMLIDSLQADNEIPPAVCGLIFDLMEQAEVLAQWTGSGTQKLISWAYFFCFQEKPDGSREPYTQQELARIWNLTPARINQFLRGYQQRGKRIPGTHEQLLPILRRKLGLE